MSDLVPQPTEVINPATGEAIELATATTDLLAAERNGVTHLRNALNAYAAFLDEELTRRLDKANTRSADVGGWHIETKAPTTLTFNPESLATAVLDLIAEDLLEESVLAKVLIPQPSKVNNREVQKLLKHADSRVRDHIRAVGTEEHQRRNVAVRVA